MLEKPDLADERLTSTLQAAFALDVDSVAFLPLGTDVDTAVYRADGGDGPYFVKLRRGENAGKAVEIARLLHELGIEQVIPPLRTRVGHLWAEIDEFTVSVLPFIDGVDGFNRRLSDDNWIALGTALKRVHTADLPDSLRKRLPLEDFSDHWRDLTRSFQAQAEAGPFPDKAAERLAEIMREKQDLITDLVERTQRLCNRLREQALAFVPCHADIHAGNVLIDASRKLHIVDWDTFMLAPKERDLMFIGGGIGSDWRGDRPDQLFYQGYGRVNINLVALTYYRCERIIQDFAEFGKQLFLSDEGGADREQALVYFASNFDPGSTLDIALASEDRVRAQAQIDANS